MGDPRRRTSAKEEAVEVHDPPEGGGTVKSGSDVTPVERPVDRHPLTEGQVYDPYGLPEDPPPVKKTLPPPPDFAVEAELGGVGSAYDAWYRLQQGS